jgi:folate-binding protein YgfZ
MPQHSDQNMKFGIIRDALVFEGTGKDIVRYLHNRLTNDIRGLKFGQTVRAAALTPQGKIEAELAVVSTGPDQYLLVTDGGDPTVVEKALTRFVVADRVSISNRTDSYSLLHFYAPVPQELSTSGYLLPHQRSVLLGTDLLISKDQRGATTELLTSSGWQNLSHEEQRTLRYQAGIPSYPDELYGVLLPEADLPHLVSFQKGCYAGQEVVEKIAARGRPPRLIRFGSVATDAPLAVGDPIVRGSDGQAVGTIHGSLQLPSEKRQLICVHVRNDSTLERDSLMTQGAPITLVRNGGSR